MRHRQSDAAARAAGLPDHVHRTRAGASRAARRNLSGFGDVEIVEGNFEEWVRPSGAPFDLVFAATAWLWIDPKVRYQKAWEVLRTGGHLAFWHAVDVFRRTVIRSSRRFRTCTKRSAKDCRPTARGPVRMSSRINTTRLKRVVCSPWSTSAISTGRRLQRRRLCRAARHVLGPYRHGTLAAERLYAAIRMRLCATSGRRPPRRHWGTVLHIAKRLEQTGVRADRRMYTE